MKRAALILLGWLPSGLAFSQEAHEVIDLGGSYYSIQAVYPTLEERTEEIESEQFGPMSVETTVQAGRLRRYSNRVTFDPGTFESQFGSFGISISFETPADFRNFDLLRVDVDHDEEINPLSTIVLYLEDGSRYDLQRKFRDPFGRWREYLPNQEKFPLYEFIRRSGVGANPLKVERMLVWFAPESTGRISVRDVTIESVRAPTHTFLNIAEGPTGQIILETNRAIPTEEVYRLEVSDDLENWGIKSSWYQGTGEKVVFTKEKFDGSWYRVIYLNYVEVGG